MVAASTDPLEKAQETVKEHSLTFPIGYALPMKESGDAGGVLRGAAAYPSGHRFSTQAQLHDRGSTI